MNERKVYPKAVKDCPNLSQHLQVVEDFSILAIKKQVSSSNSLMNGKNTGTFH